MKNKLIMKTYEIAAYYNKMIQYTGHVCILKILLNVKQD